jgi:hypothetical protein
MADACGRRAAAAGTGVGAGAVVLLAADRSEERMLLEPIEAKTKLTHLLRNSGAPAERPCICMKTKF